ncbi:MAG: hypothetical protein JWL83_272 [Actinomycetia bacterium]|nr:hypothetical protein [Actinomycetes bacterium]
MNDARDPEVLRALAARIDAAPSVARRSGGVLGTAAAYLPGERIEGLRVRDGIRLEVHVVMRWGSKVDDVERDILEAIGSLWPPTAVDVVIDDIALSGTHERGTDVMCR